MKIFTPQLLTLDYDEYGSDAYIDLAFAFAQLIISFLFGYVFLDQLVHTFDLFINQNISFLSLDKSAKLTVLLTIPTLILFSFITIKFLYISYVKIFIQKTHPIYHFINKRKIANTVCYTVAELLQSYYQLNKPNDKQLMINLLEDSNFVLLEKLDEQIYNALQQYSGNGDFNLSNFPIYQQLFMAVVAPLEIRKLNDKLTKIEKDFAYVENKLSPKQFLDMIDKLKKMMNVHFTHNEYNDYKQWHILAHNKIYSIVDKKRT